MADVCRFAHPQPPMLQGVPQDMLLVQKRIARVGALRLSLLDRHEGLLGDVVEAAQSGGLPAVGYAVAHAGRVVWPVAVPCDEEDLHTRFPVVPWRDMVSARDASLGGCARGTPTRRAWTRRWQARAVVTYLSGVLFVLPRHHGGIGR